MAIRGLSTDRTAPAAGFALAAVLLGLPATAAGAPVEPVPSIARCAGGPPSAQAALASGDPSSLAPGRARMLVDPAEPIAELRHLGFGPKTDYANVMLAGEPAIRALSLEGASGLLRFLDLDPAATPRLAWRWRVDDLQEGADLRAQGRDDFAAAILVSFGRPSLFSPRVPTLAYVYTSARLAPGTMLPSVRTPLVRTIVLRAGAGELGRWLEEERDLLSDYKAAFGEAPGRNVGMIALWTDADQTRERAEAYYGALCALPPRAG